MRYKQSLLLACAALVTSAASAQSSVTVNGMVDLGMFRGFDGINQVGTVQRSNVAMSGVEDLGGGIKLVFRLSTRFELDTGQNEGAGVKPFWYDESSLGVQSPWGTVRVGRAMTALWANDWKFDPWSNFNRIASPAWQHWHYLTPSDPFGNSGTAEYGRLNNGIFYDSPTVAGFTLRVSGTPERQRELGATTRPISSVLEYGAGPVAAMVAHERNSIGDKVDFIAGKYTFGDAAVMAAFDDSRALASDSRSLSSTLSATYRTGPRTVLKAGYSRQRLNALPNRFVSFGADYTLSRRTVLYASLGSKRDTGAARRTAFGWGISHSF